MHIRYKSTTLKTILFLSSITLLTILSLSIFSCWGGGGGSSRSGTGNGSSHSATLTWDAPTTNADGTPLTDLEGYAVPIFLFSIPYVVCSVYFVGREKI